MKNGEYYSGTFYQARKVVWLIASLGHTDFRELANDKKFKRENFSSATPYYFFVIQVHFHSMKVHYYNAILLCSFSTFNLKNEFWSLSQSKHGPTVTSLFYYLKSRTITSLES